MNKTILFFLALVLAATTACGRGSSNNNPVKEETMATDKMTGGLWIRKNQNNRMCS